MCMLLMCAFTLLAIAGGEAGPSTGSAALDASFRRVPGKLTSNGNATSLQCIEGFSHAVDQLYTNASHDRSLSIEKLVRKQLVPCLADAEYSRTLDARLLAADIANFPRTFFTSLANRFNSQTSLPYNIAIDFLPRNTLPAALVDEILAEIKMNMSTAAHTGYLYGGVQLPALAGNGAMADLSQLVVDEGPQFGWLDILPFVRQQMATYAGKLVGIPLDGRTNMIFYRSDLLEKLNVREPATYDDLLTLVSRVNGTRLGPNGQPIWGLCIPYLGKDKDCTLMHNFLWDVLAPYTQTLGPTHGMAVDPENLDILFDSEAGIAAVELMTNLLKYTHPNRPCGDVSRDFAEGRCFATFGRVGQFKANHMGSSSVVRDRSVAYPCPGSTRVLDRTTRKLVPCTSALCPYARVTQLLDGSSKLVNTAPFASTSGYAVAVSSVAATAQRLATFRYLNYVAQSEDLRDGILNPNTTWGPCRRSHFNATAWVARGYPRAATERFLTTTRLILGGHPNVALPPNFIKYSYVMLQFLSVQLSLYTHGRISGPVMLRKIATKWRTNFQEWGVQSSLLQLRAALNWIAHNSTDPPGSPTSTPPMDELASLDSTNWRYITTIAVTGVFLSVGLVTLVLVYMKSKKEGKDLFGNVLPPNEGKSSTLLVTDMQDSTLLWESLPMDVMDVVLKVHHSCLRSLLPSHRGYESTTEGDSLILAFHDAQTALSYALAAQEALLQAPWPFELLEHPLCKPVHMRLVVDRPLPVLFPVPGDPLEMQLHVGGAPNGVDEHGILGGLACMLSRPLVSEDMEAGVALTFGDVCRHAWEHITTEAAASEGGEVVLAFRGARVRMGLHSGVEAGENKVNSLDDRRTHYSGTCLDVAKLVADCGSGGTVSISAATYNQLSMEKLWTTMKLWHAGLHVVNEAVPAMHIYQVLPPALSCRVSCLPAVRSLRQVAPGTLQAPAGNAAIAFMTVAGLDTLQRWNYAVTQQALMLWQQLVLQQLLQHGGYPVEAKGNMVLVAFACAKTALVWATHCAKELLDANWPPELLNHEMGEAVSVLLETEREGEWRSELMMRGLRVKVGIDWGPVLCSVQPITGKMSYTGKVMNRAARLAAKAAPGQVLTSSYSWATAAAVPFLAAAPLGPVKLKGVPEDIYLMQVKLCRSSDVRRVDVSLVDQDTLDPSTPSQSDHRVSFASQNDVAAKQAPATSVTSNSEDFNDQLYTGQL